MAEPKRTLGDGARGTVEDPAASAPSKTKASASADASKKSKEKTDG